MVIMIMIMLILYLIGAIITGGIIDYNYEYINYEDGLLTSASFFILGLFWPILFIFVIIRFSIKRVAKICALIDGIHCGLTKEKE